MSSLKASKIPINDLVKTVFLDPILFPADVHQCTAVVYHRGYSVKLEQHLLNSQISSLAFIENLETQATSLFRGACGKERR